ncbi:MAG: serine hydrolase [Sphingobacteriales bacterium]|nr:serine hydrolase [Sphingobacteriales bacterium]
MKYVFSYMMLMVYCVPLFAQPGSDSLFQFLQANKNRSSLYLVQNDTVKARLNENKLMPLASTVKIMIAIEFAKQAGSHIVNVNDKVALQELDKYYIPNTDGGAHLQWLQYEKKSGNIQNDSVPLVDVARGMMMFSSNANTEYLQDLLGMDNVKNNIQLLGLSKHTAIFPLVASLFMYQNPKKIKEEKIIKGIKKLSEEAYCRYIYDMHNALKYDTILKASFRPQDLSLAMQKEWSDRLPASTTKEYVHIANVLNNRKYFSEEAYAVIAELLETIMENPANRQWLKHAGMKGGSTLFVLTKTLYATLKNGDRIELSYFFNDLSPVENEMLQNWMNSFELSVLSSPRFRDTLAATFK